MPTASKFVDGSELAPYPLHPRPYTLLLLSGFFGLLGCSGLVVPETPAIRRTVEQLEAPLAQPWLQVLITYNGPISTHAALRLEHPARSLLFWDPAGRFGKPSPENGAAPGIILPRHNDVIRNQAATLPAYWKFVETTGDTAMEVLGWTLSESQADKLYRALTRAAQPEGGNGFSTVTTEPLCAIAVSDFLHRFGAGVVQVQESYLFPASLAEQLRTQNPDSIVVFVSDEPPREFRPLEKTGP